MADFDSKNERNGILGSVVIHSLLFVAFYFVEAKPEPVDQLGYIQVEFGEFAEGRAVKSVPESVPEPTPPPEEPEIEETPEEVDPLDSKPVDLPDAEPLPEEPEIESPDTETEAIVPEEPEDEPAEEDQEERPAEVKPLGSGVTDSNSGSESGDDGDGSDAEKASPVFIEGLERDLMARFLPPNSSGVNADIKVRIFVGPDGTVKRTILVQKGDPQLDMQTLIAVRKWKFNELPPNAPQELQEGVVTFKFRVD
ncbi:MAG: energy transducer TonB [Rhodothermaceae bacterium]|nr:energy transducer TonB [Rhodothermaceae bacterium]